MPRAVATGAGRSACTWVTPPTSGPRSTPAAGTTGWWPCSATQKISRWATAPGTRTACSTCWATAGPSTCWSTPRPVRRPGSGPSGWRRGCWSGSHRGRRGEDDGPLTSSAGSDTTGASTGTDAGLTFGSARARWVLLATVGASGMAFLDSTVVNVALPQIGDDFSASLAGLQWVINGYLLTT